MGMYDTIANIPVKCPKCGDESLKSAQIKSGPKVLDIFNFREDRIPMDWDYQYYGSIIEKKDKENGKIRGIAECIKCRKRVQKRMNEIIDKYKEEGKLICSGDATLLIQCKLGEKNALEVVLSDLDKEFGGNRYSESLFDIILIIKNNIAIEAEINKEDE